MKTILKLLLALMVSACAANPIGHVSVKSPEADEGAPVCPRPAPTISAPSARSRPSIAADAMARGYALEAVPAAKPAPAIGSGARIAQPKPPANVSSAPRATGPVTAGLVDDNERWADYLAYRRRAGGFEVRERAVEERIVIEVRDAQGRPVHDAAVEAGGTLLRTDSSGRALFHPFAAGRGQQARWTVRAHKLGATAEAVAELGQPNNVRVTLPVARTSGAPRLDLLFMIDTTGSMADEIERLRATMDTIVKSIGKADIRYGLVHYRDRGDEYVVQSHDFTPSLRGFREELACLRAAGGGDYPESLNAALNAAVHRMTWRGEGAVRMVMVIADAPPHLDYRDEPFDYAQDMTHAAARGIKIFPIGASGLNGQGEYIFRQMAQFTGGKFVFLTYADRRRPGEAPGVETGHDVRNYSVDNLDRIVVRLVTEELRPLQ